MSDEHLTAALANAQEHDSSTGHYRDCAAVVAIQEERRRRAVDQTAQAAGQALEAAYPFGYWGSGGPKSGSYERDEP